MLSIDIETYSSFDIKKCGAYRYTEAPDFTILLFAYAYDDEPVEIIDLTKETLPKKLLDDLVDPNILKSAFNANFERTCISKYTGLFMDPSQWRCTMVKSLYLGLPASLEKVGEVLNLSGDKQKMKEGKALIRYFSIPCKPTKANGGRTRNLPEHDLEKWQMFKEYCKRDVEVERTIRKLIDFYKITDSEQKLWELDQQINDTGIKVDKKFIESAINCDTEFSKKLKEEAIRVTGLRNPNSVSQLTSWVEEKLGKSIEGLRKEIISNLLKEIDNEEVIKALKIRQLMSKTSVKKYEAMEKSMCDDRRIRGLLQFYGANRTGRWCLTGDHEVLTKDGWVRLDQWKGGSIACWNNSMESISFQKSTALSFDYKGDMYNILSKRCDQLSTPDHKMPYWTKNNNWGVDTVENLAKKRFCMPFTGKRSVNNSLDHIELRILIMTQADGHYTQDGDLRFHFSKQRKIDRCKSLLRKAGICFSISVCKNNSTITVKSRFLPIYLRSFRSKKFGMWLLDESADVIFDELEQWDGSRTALNSMQYVSTIKENAEIIQMLAHLSGRAASIVVKEGKKKNHNEAYVVNVWLKPLNRNEIREKPKKCYFEGKVYCAETKTGFFLVRRNGKVWVTGNSGKTVQTQNLPQNHLPDLHLARDLVKSREGELVDMLFGSLPNTLSELIRTSFIASENSRFIVSDFSAIEARVISWLAGETWRLDVFKTHGKIYEASASQMFKVPIVSITKTSPLRQKGKVSELALGYQGGSGALKAMGALKMGLDEEELPELVKAWREANSRIVKLWKDVEAAAKKAIREKTVVTIQYNIKFFIEKGILFIQLPSGRRLSYLKVKLEPHEKFQGTKITYEGMDQTSKQWKKLDTYGGKLVENIVQAIARDCLAVAMLRVNEAGYNIVMHVHDEMIIDTPNGFGSLDEVNSIMAQPIDWAPGLPLKGDGYETEYYKKD